ncbi:EGF-like domain protein [Cooperia oncophora]
MHRTLVMYWYGLVNTAIVKWISVMNITHVSMVNAKEDFQAIGSVIVAWSTKVKVQEKITYCQFEPCFNNGTCVERFADGYSCNCLEGCNCETWVDLCAGWLCENGGSCVVQEHHPELCANFTCEHGGTCVIEDYEAKCECLTGYGGVHCEKELTDCEEFPDPLKCLNSGTCMVVNRTQHCECSIDFFGTNCEVFGVSAL